MANGSIITNSGRKIIINRSYKATPDYTVPSEGKVGISNTTPNIADTDLDVPIPISNGTVNDNGDNTLTGSSGGDNSTDNTTTFKPGAGLSDDTSQNLIANNTNATKIWTIANLAALGTNMTAAEPASLWLYILDATALAKFLSAGTAIEVKWGSDAANYYSKTWTAAELATGWNYLTTGTTNVEDLTETGTVVGNIDTFIIEITTNNATDTFVAGDVLYDLLRQWAASDLTKAYATGFPTIDEVNFEAQARVEILSTQANGFDVNGFGLFNTDTTVLMHSEDTFTAESKSDTDQFTFIAVDRLI